MNKKIKLFSMFSGYGGAEFALQKAGIDLEIVGYSEIDKYAIQCYSQNHRNKCIFCNSKSEIYHSHGRGIWEGMGSSVPEGMYKCSFCNAGKKDIIRNYGDATRINEKELPDFDLLTGGFPCQSFSVAGKGAGVCDSRGNLFWDILRIAKEKQPKYMLLENVKGITNKNHRETFNKILLDLVTIGYDVHWKILNSKDFGIPQNRERVWFVCIRKDLKQDFEFPKGKELKIFLKDILEDEVEDKYYLTKKALANTKYIKNGKYKGEKEFVANCMTSSMHKGYGNDGVTVVRNKIIQVNNPKHSNNRVYSPKGISPTLNTMQGGNRQPFITIDSSVKPSVAKNFEREIKGIEKTEKDIYTAKAKAGWQDNRIGIKISPTVRAGNSSLYGLKNKTVRKLTPKECFRLMGFLDDEINTENLSNTQKYKLAGNGWTISPASEILKKLIK